MEVIGYSERGIINSLVYELKYSKNNLRNLNKLLTLIKFPYANINFNVTNAKLLIEQSFSDFGDSDLLMLIENNGQNELIFIEAKVKTSQKPKREIVSEFNNFKLGINQNKCSSSNLFIQLYHKLRLVEELKGNGLSQLQSVGVTFPSCSSKLIRKIGNNKVVIRAAKEILKFIDNAYYVALVPDTNENLEVFYDKAFRNYYPSNFPGWDTQNWGYLSWDNVERFCKDNKFTETLKVFDWNEEQIHSRPRS